MHDQAYTAAIHEELAFPGKLVPGAVGLPVKRVQEWLCFHKFGTAIDSKFGTATRTALVEFQEAHQLEPLGYLDGATWTELVLPLRRVLKDGSGSSLRERVSTVAKNHLAAHPIELGGSNRGHTGGEDGPEWLWCAAFVTFILKQACAELKIPMPVRGSVSCDSLAAQAMDRGLFVSEEKSSGNWDALGDVYIFLVRKTGTDWTHTGFGFEGTPEAFSTIEGNANENGERGFEVCRKTRSALKKDFVLLPV